MPWFTWRRTKAGDVGAAEMCRACVYACIRARACLSATHRARTCWPPSKAWTAPRPAAGRAPATEAGATSSGRGTRPGLRRQRPPPGALRSMPSFARPIEAETWTRDRPAHEPRASTPPPRRPRPQHDARARNAKLAKCTGFKSQDRQRVLEPPLSARTPCYQRAASHSDKPAGKVRPGGCQAGTQENETTRVLNKATRDTQFVCMCVCVCVCRERERERGERDRETESPRDRETESRHVSQGRRLPPTVKESTSVSAYAGAAARVPMMAVPCDCPSPAASALPQARHSSCCATKDDGNVQHHHRQQWRRQQQKQWGQQARERRHAHLRPRQPAPGTPRL
jgi:hypothetical protein